MHHRREHPEIDAPWFDLDWLNQNPGFPLDPRAAESAGN